MSKLEIRPVAEADRAEWEALYRGYAEFYEMPMNEEILGHLWGWLMDPEHEVEGLVAGLDGELVGLAHFRRMPSPLRGRDVGFLDDLFVSPSARGSQIGGALLDRLAQIARERGWPAVRWITQDHNYRARTLYDRVATKTLWNWYEMDTRG